VSEVEDLVLLVATKEGILETVPDEKCLQVFPLVSNSAGECTEFTFRNGEKLSKNALPNGNAA
jgi:hypothetical protein